MKRETEATHSLVAHWVAAARSAGVSLAPLGTRQFTLSGHGDDGCALHLQGGWLTASAPWPGRADDQPLVTHADWFGPAKLDVNGAAMRKLELPLAYGGFPPDDAGDDEGSPSNADRFLSRLLAGIPGWMHGRAAEDWEPPSAEALSNWLTAAGYTVAIDAEGSLRTTLDRKGCDGQVRIERRTGRLRLAMRIGAWREPTPSALQAMQRLARIANHHTRLVRIAWMTDGEQQRCDAVVDLTGFPELDEADSASVAAWPVVLTAALDGLQLALNRLGLELEALADPDNADVVAAFSAA